MYGARLPRQVDLAGAHDDRKPAKPFLRTRSFVAGSSVRRCLERASGQGACAVSWRQLRDELAPYDVARHFVGLSERSWLNWTEQIRQRCGEELLRRGMFPPRKYFSSEMTDWRSTAAD